ncbi:MULTISPECIES: DUF1294 domain-containing protein [Vibrio]|jgi:uncharacterized membrane protein YsdA (DUF1294 family)|uniref:DUF1294 domain-containing protein n=3 Tax=Vibrio cyclitrophicus TaxID=47951 RepID=A0A7Z1MEP0_9VIBR|nr:MULTISPECIES: DUF1294 domain-containing protein [Vibrio]KNH11590.1 membrane protein [Vibrio lentus]MBY7659526.1 DUF1294 domain-containing protein [Vibrio atlanticus]KAA8602650.1 hypothetical protein F0Z19_0183 [Vibrio cyclitrophicus]MBE8558175.1 DUF1294 domain-containing protein [Vibrio sp. OPT24]MBU2932026.1 DUF1294 domain-containing protein [Vibrio cyclitrophicus]|tara:strand:+ start:176 stop:565 length:390 start_codon:yes stop_codon:yes gene_type:complete
MLSSSIQIAITYMVLVVVSVLFVESSKALLAWYLVIGVVTFFVYAKDKRAAINGNWRVPEKTLHILSVAGGWLGALIAQDKLRHKTQKQPFRAIYWLTVSMNVAAFVWTLTPSGQALFGRWLSEIIGYL